MNKYDADYDLIKRFCAPLALETIKIFKSSSEESELHDKYYQIFLEIFIEKLLVDTLNVKPDSILTQTDLERFLYANYKSTKLLLQNSVANAFTEVMSKYNGKQIDYFCEIAPMPEPINKRPI